MITGINIIKVRIVKHVLNVKSKKKPADGLLSLIAAPARRALQNAAIDSLEKLAQFSEKDILNLHGFGPGSIPKLSNALKDAGLEFKK